jgi:ice-binding like protein
MSKPAHRNRFRLLGLALAATFAFVAFPAGAQAVPINLATAGPFVVLGGQEATNTGPSVLYGDLGVSPGTSLTGFNAAVVNGVTHNNDGVAAQAQSDLTAAYNVAAGEPVAPANDLTGSNLGNRTLTAGNYRYTSSAQLTGTVTLDAQGDPNAQFVFEIGSALTTAPASSVALINGASPCNVFWQVGSSATIDTTTAFQGTVMALTSIELHDGASVKGRMLARNGTVSLINNVLDSSMCNPGSTSPGTSGANSGSSGAPSSGTAPGAGTPTRVTRNGTATIRPTPRAACTDGFRATVRGRMIKRVVFSLDGRRFSVRTRPLFQVFVRAAPGRHRITARVTFRDATRARTLTVGYRACAARVLRPRRGPSRFTG